ncbi:unnamed protein product [Callosobruchus maculatus]|uniref:Tc1-like transposase DDE domain-containing protein n=1 Tax=Callosobruchus maculatus TaxID=64391 RepID=A0A653DNU5_CALMS|nr:unnamed protein product [Callosobruchus maculatus]
MTVNKCWQGDGVIGVTKNISSTGRLIVVHAGSMEGFVKGAELVFQAGTTTGDYHGQMNKQNFERWLTRQLLPNIPPNSVLVFDNAPYHSEIMNRVPTKYSTKIAMIEWLVNNNIPHDPSESKADLMRLIDLHKPLDKVYRIDEIVRQAGHVALRLPPDMCELNPIELAWAGVKRYVRERNTSGNLSKADLKHLTYEAIASIGKDDWEGYVKHVMAIENSYWERHQRMENVVAEFIIDLGNASSSDSESSSDTSSEED